jgi:hypothetical protein
MCVFLSLFRPAVLLLLNLCGSSSSKIEVHGR